MQKQTACEAKQAKHGEQEEEDHEEDSDDYDSASRMMQPTMEHSLKKNLRDYKFFTRRWVLAYLLCVVRICQTALRQCIGMAIVCMTGREFDDVTTTVETTSLDDTSLTNVSSVVANNLTQQDPSVAEFAWSQSLEGHVLGAYYYGFVVTVMVAGYVDRGIGSVRTIAVGIAGGGVVNLLTPVLTRQHHYFLVTLRVLAGCCNGLIDPAMQTLWSNWAPVEEQGQLTAVEYSGNGIGGILTFLISAFLCQIPVDRGWPFVFYFYGSVSLLFTLVWCTLASDRPESHVTITQRELRYITDHRSQLCQGDKPNPPWGRILRSGAVWAILVAHVSFSWVFSWILAYLPMYMHQVLHFDIAQNGMLSSLPFVGKLITGVLGGYLADVMIRRHCRVALLRKTLQMVGSVGCAVPLLLISLLSEDQRVVAVVLLVLSVSLQNLTSVAYRINSLDIAPRYAGFLMSMTSTVASALTLTAPHVTSVLLVNQSREDWQRVLYVVAAVSTLGGVVFLVCARGTVQDWARGKDIEHEIVSPAPIEPISSLEGGETPKIATISDSTNAPTSCLPKDICVRM